LLTNENIQRVLSEALSKYDRIVVDSAVPPRGIQLEHAQGVLAQEVPRINGYHPLVK
jgi:hypothetical protein